MAHSTHKPITTSAVQAPKSALNPVEKQIAIMGAAWSAFSKNTSKRILVWQVSEEAMSLVDAFVEMQQHPTHLSTGDTFMLIKTPYQHALQYSYELKKAFCEQAGSLRDCLLNQPTSSKQESASNWSCKPDKTLNNTAGVIKNMLSFGTEHHRSIKHLSPVLMPDTINDAKAYSKWILEILSLDLPERFRVILVETIEHPYLQHFLSSKDSRILIQRHELNMGLLAQQTFAQEKTTSPAGDFRNLLIAVTNQVETGNVSQVKSKATEALNFARQQQWKDQEVVIRMLFAGSLMKANRFSEAIQVYQLAGNTAEQAAQEKHPAGQKLIIQSWFAQAGAELADGSNRAAAKSYDQAAIAAKKDNNLSLTLEAFRMAGFALSRDDSADKNIHKKNRNDKEALIRGQYAVDTANTMKPNERAMTAIGTCIVDMMRIIDDKRVQDIQTIKSSYTQRQLQIQRYTEKRGTELIHQGKANALTIANKEQLSFQEKALEEAATPLLTIIASACPNFQHWTNEGKRLLGKNWLLTNDISLPITSHT